MKKLSVCIVTHNNESNISLVLDSIYKNSKNLDIEVFVVDNHSEDNTAKIVKNNFPKVNLIILSENKGFGYGHNQILNKITSDFHVILNPDITFTSDIFGDLSNYLEDNPDVVMVTPNILNDDGSTQYLPKRTPKLKYLISGRLEKFGGKFKKWRDYYTCRNESFNSPIEVDFCTGCFTMIRTDVFKKLNGFDTRFFMYLEDADLTRRAQQYGKTVFNPLFCATHSWERSSSKNLKYLCIHISSMIKYFCKWY